MTSLERRYPLCYNISWDDGPSETVTKTVNNYIATDGKYVYTLLPKSYSSDFAALHLKEPQIKISNFEGCPHFYGTMYLPNGDCYELQCIITKEFLNEVNRINGDWTGYKEGDSTARFLSKTSLMSAFKLFKMVFNH